MTIISSGYPGTIAPGAVWSQMQLGLGKRYFVEDASVLSPSAVAGGLNFTGGIFGGWGIVDNSTGEHVDVPEPVSGVVYYMVAARRTWGSGSQNRTEIVTVAAGGTFPQTIPPGRMAGGKYAEADDQPLWIVSRANGSTVPLVIADLRVLGAGPAIQQVNHALALGYLDREGTEVAFGSLRYRYGSSDVGIGGWSVTQTFPSNPVERSFWTVQSQFPVTYQWAQKVNGVVHLRMTLTYIGSRILANSASQANPGNIPDTTMGKLPDRLRPVTAWPFLMTAWLTGSGYIGDDGTMVLGALGTSSYIDSGTGLLSIGVSYPALTP